jgi:hypothetical protein
MRLWSFAGVVQAGSANEYESALQMLVARYRGAEGEWNETAGLCVLCA